MNNLKRYTARVLKDFDPPAVGVCPCDTGELVEFTECEAALAAKDARIKELELKLAQSLNRKCNNCKHTATSIADEPCCNCDQTKSKWEPQP